MVVALDPAVVEKITRRAKRAWEDFDKGGSAAFHRISHLTKDNLQYRLRHEPGKYSRGGKKIKVVRSGKDILVAPRDPKLDLQEKKHLKELKDREGPVRAYRLVAKDGNGPQKSAYDTKLKVGDKITFGTIAVGTFEWCKEHFRHKNYPNGERILAIEFQSEEITDRDPTLRVNAGEVVEELDLIALGIKPTPTTGLLDCLTKKDAESVQDHAGTIRAYRLAGPTAAKLSVGDKTALAVGSLERCKANYARGSRIFAVTFDADDITSLDDEIVVKAAEVKEELDLVVLGLKKTPKPGVLDCLTDQDVKDFVEDHVGTIRAYKHVTKDGDSPHQTNKIRYELGKKYEEPNADTNRDKDCSHGLNVASLEWVKRDRKDATHRLFAVELDSTDLACVPAKTDGKFRTRKLTVVAEIDPQTDKEIATVTPPPPPPKPTIIEELYNRDAKGKKIDPATPTTPTPKPEKPAKAKKDGLIDKLKKKLKGKSKGKE